MSNDLVFQHVSEAHLEKLKTYFQQNNVTGLEGNQGNASGHCLDFDFEYDPVAQRLQLNANSLPKDLKGLPDGIRDECCKTLISNVMGNRGATRPMRLSTTDSYPSHPGKYGVYDYVIPYITNSSGLDFTFSSQTMNHGGISSHLKKVDNGVSVVKLLEADSSKLSGVGVGGTVVYQWGDGSTIMSIQFFLNTEFTHSFTVGASGSNAGKLSFAVTDDSPVVSGYTYLDPKITVTVSS